MSEPRPSPPSLAASAGGVDGHAAAWPLAAARHLSELMASREAFSFLRLGDGELRLLLAHQHGDDLGPEPILRASCEIAFGSPGLTAAQCSRLLLAYENCSFLDLYGGLPFNRENLPRLRWQRAAGTLGETSSGEDGLLFAWIFHELRTYLQSRRCVICGAEASLLRELLADPRYREIVSAFFPPDAPILCLQPRRDGAEIAQDLDAIKDDLRTAIREHRADTLLLSLGGAAKIICHELAEEMNIHAIDFGSALRALTYSGSDGYATWRSSHHPFLVRVPLSIYLPALQRARPDLGPAGLFAKAHAQLCLEMQSKMLLRSNTSDVNDRAYFDASGENVGNFFESLRYYREGILPLGRQDPEARALAREFRRWRQKNGLGWDGKLFQLGVKTKGILRRHFPGLLPS